MKRSVWLTNLCCFVACALLVIPVGCGSPSQMERVLPMAGRDVAGLSADQMARAMRRAGFTDRQILRHGPDVRNALATAGSAQLRVGEVVRALFAIEGERLYVSSRTHGAFIMRLDEETAAE